MNAGALFSKAQSLGARAWAAGVPRATGVWNAGSRSAMRLGNRAMARGASRGTALMGVYNAGGWRAAGGMLGGAAAAGAWKGAAIGAGVGASMSLASDAWNGNYSGSVGRAFGAGLRGGVMGGGIGAVGGIGHSFFGAPRRLGTAMNRSAALRMPAPSRMSRAMASSRRVGPVGAARGMQGMHVPAPAMSARGGMSMNYWSGHIPSSKSFSTAAVGTPARRPVGKVNRVMPTMSLPPGRYPGMI